MRLGQLARKLALRPAEIVNFLAQRSIQIDSGSNTRLEDSHVAILLEKFAPNGLVNDIAEIEDEPETKEESPLPEPVTDVVEQVVNAAPAINEEEKIEVIKAPKIELSGLKVLGKIELPELKKKEPLATDENQAEVAPAIQREPRREVRPYQQRKDRASQQQRPAKNPIAVQREREAREEEERKKAAIEREKEKRTLHYMKKVNVVQPTKAVRVVEEKTEEEVATPAPAPKTLWGKFKRWLRS